jgi:hypothetical protein
VGDEVYFLTTGTTPTGINARQVYYVHSVPTVNTFKVTISPTGEAVDFTTNGTGTLSSYKLTEPRVRYLNITAGVCRSAGDDKNPFTLYYSNALSGL